jgi:hypothetical protein
MLDIIIVLYYNIINDMSSTKIIKQRWQGVPETDLHQIEPIRTGEEKPIKQPDLTHWNWRIFHYKSGKYGIHEAYYDKNGKVNGYTQDALIVGDSVKELFDVLNMIKRDMKQLPEVLDYEKDTTHYS